MAKHNFRVVTVCQECGEPQNDEADVVILITVEPEMMVKVIGCHGMSDKDLEKIITNDIPKSFKKWQEELGINF